MATKVLANGIKCTKCLVAMPRLPGQDEADFIQQAQSFGWTHTEAEPNWKWRCRTCGPAVEKTPGAIQPEKVSEREEKSIGGVPGGIPPGGGEFPRV